MAGLRMWGVRAIDPGSGVVLEHATIAVENGRITEIAEARGETPRGAYDGRGRSVLPGLIDCHTHLISDTSRAPGFGPAPLLKGEDPRPRELGYLLLARSCRALIGSGVTTIRDVGSNDDEAIVMRRAVELGLVDGPRIFSCGRIVSATSPGGRMFGTMYAEADGPWSLRQAVRAELRRGADFIKVMATGARSVEREDPEPAQLTREELAALVDEAHRLGMRVAAHAEGLAGARLAIEEGVDTIEHGLSLHREPELLDRMAASGQVLVPTLSTFHDLAERFADQWLPRLVDQARRQLDEAYLTLEAAQAAGVTLAMGFDSGPPGSEPWELIRMAEGGLGPRAALRAATAGGAAALGRSDIGRLAPGAAADLLVIDGDPLADPRVLVRPSRMHLVLRNGIPIAGRDIDPARLGGQAPPPDDSEIPQPIGQPSCCAATATRE